jgi:cytochrome b561/polyisoprenoid-binding protein YceI
MELDDTNEGYNKTARFFHWAVAILIFVLLAVGFYMGSLPNGPDKFQVYGLHKSFGLLVLWLAGLRIVWRHVSGAPASLSTHANWEKGLAKATHIFLYAAMFGMPLSGWLMSSAGEYPVKFFGLPMPALMGKDQTVFHWMKETHEILAFLLIAAVAMHAAGAIKHHVIDRDETLSRMVPRAYAWPVLIWTAVFFAAVAGAFIIAEVREDHERQKPETISAAPATEMPAFRELAPNEWQIIPAQSKLSFTARLSGTPFEGVFGEFNGTVFFDPENLPLSRVSIVIPISSLTTGNAERDAQIGTPDWFDTANFPTATFESVEFAKGEGNNYIAIGNLTLRGVSLPMTLPFTLVMSADAQGRQVAKMSGKAELNRLDYGIGQGQWAGTGTVADGVTVSVSVTALGS